MTSLIARPVLRDLAACLLILLAACQAAPMRDTTPPAMAMIEVAAGGGFSGMTTTRIYADGTLTSDVSGGEMPARHSVRHADPRTFTAAAAVLADHGRRSKAAMASHPHPCLDYGSDSVRATPPIAGFDQITTECPDAAVTALMDQVLAALAPK